MRNYKQIIKELSLTILVLILTFAFLAFINWGIHFQEWNGFSRFMLGVVGVGVLLKICDILDII